MILFRAFGFLVAGFVTVFLFFVFAQVGAFMAVYQSIAVWFSANTTLDEQWTALLAAVATAAAWSAIPGIFGFVVFGKKPAQAVATITIAAVLMGGVLYFAGGEAFFDVDGRPTRCYGITPDGIKVASFPRPATNCPVDRTFSTPMHPMSADIVPSVLAARRGIVPDRLDLAAMGPDFAYFSASTGKPRVYYFLTESGDYDLFNGPGFHPSLQEPLLPITRDTAKTIRDYVLKQYREAAARREQRPPPPKAPLATRQDSAPVVAESDSADSAARAQAARLHQDSLDAEVRAIEALAHDHPVRPFDARPEWTRELVGKRISIRYSPASRQLAVTLLQRFRSIGMEATIAPVIGGLPISTPAIDYTQADIHAAEALNALIGDLARFDLNSHRALVPLQVSLP